MKNETRVELEDGIVGIVTDIRAEEDYKPPSITYLDDVEDECWELFKKYASIAGVEIQCEYDDEENFIDFSIAKEISEHIIAVVENTFGVRFPLSSEGMTDCLSQTEDNDLQDDDEWDR